MCDYFLFSCECMQELILTENLISVSNKTEIVQIIA